MNCTLENRDEILTHYVIHRLTEDESEAFERHFFACVDCTADLQMQQHVFGLLKSEPDLAKASYRGRGTAAGEETAAGSAGWSWRSHPRMVLGLAGSLFAVVLLAMYLDFQANTPPEIIDFDQTVPHVYTPRQSELRGADPENPGQTRRLYDHFTRAMLAYRDRDYDRAVALFGEEAKALAGVKSLKSPDASRLVLDYEFYWGLSHLALATTERKAAEQTTRDDHFALAITHLMFGAEEPGVLGSRSKYFLGLAHGLQGDRSNARAILQQISPGDDYYERSQKWTRFWTE